MTRHPWVPSAYWEHLGNGDNEAGNGLSDGRGDGCVEPEIEGSADFSVDVEPSLTIINRSAIKRLLDGILGRP